MSLADWGLEWKEPRRPRLSSLVRLYVLRLRRRWLQELLAVLGIAAGVALLYATQVASTSLSGPVRHITDGLVGNSQLQLLSRGTAGIPESTYDDIVALPGVRRAAPVLQVPGNLVGPAGQNGVLFFGADPRIVRLRGNLLKGFNSADAAREENIVLSAPMAREIGVAFGDDVRVEIGGRTVTVPAAVAGREQIGALVDTSIALMPLAYLQGLAGVGHHVTRVLVETEDGQEDRVRRDIARIVGPSADVRGSDWESRLFAHAASPTKQASTLFSIVSALVGWLFAVCALLVTTADRRKLAAQQHAQGAPPMTTLMTLLVDVAVVGTLGTALGLLAGEAISRQGFGSDISFLSGAFPIGDIRVVTWQSVAIAIAGGFLAAAVGVLAPLRSLVVSTLPGGARRALSRPRTRAARDRPRAYRPQLVAGLACLAVAVAVTSAAPGAAVVGLLALAAALLLLLPTILVLAGRALEWANHRGERSSAAGEFALRQLRSPRWRARAFAISATGAVAVFGATALEGARQNLSAGLADVVDGLDAVAGVWITAPGAGDVYGTASFRPTATAALAKAPGVERVDLYRAGLLDVAGRRVWIVAPSRLVANPVPRNQILDGDPATVEARVRSGGWATLTRAVADGLGVKVGDTFTLPSPRPVRLRVAAITTNLGWSSGAVTINATEYARAWRSDDVAAYHLQLAPGASPAAVRRAAATALPDGGRGLRVETAAQRSHRQFTSASRGLDRLGQIARLTLLAAVLAMSAAMIGLLWQHRPFVASLKLSGATTPLMWRSLTLETGVLFGTGVLAGATFGLLGQILCTRGLEAVTGFPVVEGLQLEIAVVASVTVLCTSLLVVLIPGYLVSRARPSLRE